jgi:hypothetical protein
MSASEESVMRSTHHHHHGGHGHGNCGVGASDAGGSLGASSNYGPLAAVVRHGMSRSVSDTTLRQPRPNLTLPLPSVTSLMQFKVRINMIYIYYTIYINSLLFIQFYFYIISYKGSIINISKYFICYYETRNGRSASA